MKFDAFDSLGKGQFLYAISLFPPSFHIASP
jgi:hypothetical protein